MTSAAIATILADVVSQVFERNSAWAKQAESYLTKLSPYDETKFQGWVKDTKAPFDPSETADYDMRGFWLGYTNGDPRARSSVNANDGKLHFDDYWKTPYHESFSSDSKWAVPGKAPSWNDRDQLVTPDGKVIFDERAK